MRGYILLTRQQYALIYMLTGVLLLVSLIGTVLGLWRLGSVIWWPTLALFIVVLGLELHSFLQRNVA